jgi:hypothetical protein
MPDTDDLWPANIADTKLTTHITILKQQAALLGQKTQQLATGEVTTQTTGNLFVHSFRIVAPTLSYRFELFQASHGVSFYPLTVRHLNQPIMVSSETEFRDKLKEIFASQATLNVVQSIVAQSRS